MTPKNSLAGCKNRLASRSSFPNRLISTLILAATLSSTVPAWADDTTTVMAATPVPAASVQPPTEPTIVPVRPGSVIPWPGLLLNPAAVAQIKVDLDSAKQQCFIVTQRAVAEQKAQSDYDAALQKAAAERQQAELNASVKSKTAEINSLTQRLSQAEKDRPNTYLWTGLGFGAGVAVTVLTVFAVAQATK